LKYIIGTRGSHLSLVQTNWVISELKKANPDADFEIKTITTKGDTDSRPLFALEQKGIFEKEIDRAVAEKEVDFAVHSLKDVPSDLDPNLSLSCIPVREAVNDVFITSDGSTLKNIKSKAVIGTSSLRRAVQVSRVRSDLVVKPIRGNVESRIRKINEGEYDGVVLAQAGINRLKLDVKASKLSTIDFPPSPGQGALGIVSRSDDEKTILMLKKIEDKDSRIKIEAERALSQYVESGCRFPVGTFTELIDDELKLTVAVYSIDGKKSIIIEKCGNKNDPFALGKLVGEELNNQGVDELALNWREKVEEWNKK
jgi:hydroxymethylbilane synthase